MDSILYSVLFAFLSLYIWASIEMSKNQNTNTTILQEILDNQTTMLDQTKQILDKLNKK